MKIREEVSRAGLAFFAWSFLALALAGCFASVGAQDRSILTDLPPAVVSGEVGDMDILADAAPMGNVILRVCKAFHADCSVVFSGAGPQLGWTCSGPASECWRTFMSVLSQVGINVRILPGIGGASYSFSPSAGLQLRSSAEPSASPQGGGQ